MSVTNLHSKSRPVQTFHPTDFGLLPSWRSSVGHLYKNFQLPGTPGNLCRNGLKFPEITGILNWWNCNIILMTIDKVYLVAIRATVILTFIPVMVRGLYDTFPESFPGYIGPFPHFLDLCWRKYWYLTLDWSRKPYNMPRKCLRRPKKTCHRVQEPSLGYKLM